MRERGLGSDASANGFLPGIEGEVVDFCFADFCSCGFQGRFGGWRGDIRLKFSEPVLSLSFGLVERRFLSCNQEREGKDGNGRNAHFGGLLWNG